MTNNVNASVNIAADNMSCYPQEKNRLRRGHDFYAGLKGIPLLYDTEDVPAEDKVIHAHYFVGGADWYVAELDPATMDAFGWARLVPGGGEWGYAVLTELEEVLVQGVFVVERDLHWESKPFKECVPPEDRR